MSSHEINYVGCLRGHKQAVTALTCGTDSQGKSLLVSGSRDKKIIIWSLHLENPVELEQESKESKEEENNKEYLVGKPYKSLTGHNHFVSSLDISSDSKFLVSGSWDKTARIWNLESFKTTAILKGHEKDVLTAKFTFDDRGVITGSMDKTLRRWEVTGTEKFKVEGFGDWVSTVDWINRGDKNGFYSVGCWDRTVKMYDKNLNLLYSLENHNYGVNTVSKDDDGEYFFSGEKNGKISVYQLEEGKGDIKSTIDLGTELNQVSFNSEFFNGIACATSQGLYVMEVNKQNKPLYKCVNKGGCHSLVWDNTKTFLFAGFSDGTIRVFKFNSKQ